MICRAQICAHHIETHTRQYLCGTDVNGRQFISRVRKWGRDRNIEVRFDASKGRGSHGTLYVGVRKTTVKDRKKDIADGLRAKMLNDLAIDPDDF